MRPLFVLSCLLNIGWLASWHALLIPLSEIVMIALLLTLIALYRRANAWRGAASASARWLVQLPLSLYLGWITVATVANTAITLLAVGVDGGSAAMALTALVIVIATGLGLLGVARRRDGVYALVIAWGLGGVAATRWSADGMGPLVMVAVACAVLLVLSSVWTVISRTGDQGTATFP